MCVSANGVNIYNTMPYTVYPDPISGNFKWQNHEINDQILEVSNPKNWDLDHHYNLTMPAYASVMIPGASPPLDQGAKAI